MDEDIEEEGKDDGVKEIRIGRCGGRFVWLRGWCVSVTARRQYC